MSKNIEQSNRIDLKINGGVFGVDAPANWTLNDVLRNRLNLTGTKRACDYGGCGSCTVIVDGVDVYSCSILAVEVQDKEILTIEGLGKRLRLQPKTIKNKMASGIFRRGVHYFSPKGIGPRFKWSAVVAWLEKREQVKKAPTQDEDGIPMARGYNMGSDSPH